MQAVVTGICARPSAFVVPNLAIRGEKVRTERAIATLLEFMIIVRMVDDVPRASIVNPQISATPEEIF
jgi:hypothetical protein